MRLVVTASQTPFIHGGADYHLQGLIAALRAHGHEVECVRFPFRFDSDAHTRALMDFCEACDLSRPNGVRIDRLISLQFPGYGVRHPHHVVWLMHQHRAVYELYRDPPEDPELARLRTRIQAFDRRTLSRARALFANSRRVAERLAQFNGLEAEPLYHPPYGEALFHCAPARPYVFYPSRLERLKRQDLLIRAAHHLRTPLVILLMGEGGQRDYYRGLIEELGVGDRVRLLGACSEAEKITYYAHCLGVFFGPFDEDYGYVTLEAMLSSKPIVTCTDSGGPLEFVEQGRTGYILPPEPEAIAAGLDRLYNRPDEARRLGQMGRMRYDERAIGWGKVAKVLTS